MSLQYIIDGYNIINHPLFARSRKKSQDACFALLDFIKFKKPCGSPKNKISVVFDGYPAANSRFNPDQSEINVIYSQDITADARIKAMLDSCQNPKIVIVVSDDREIQFFAKSAGAKAAGVEEFIHSAKIDPDSLRRKGNLKTRREDLLKPELNYTQASQINKEFRKLWLK